jgi:hypothetical protein
MITSAKCAIDAQTVVDQMQLQRQNRCSDGRGALQRVRYIRRRFMRPSRENNPPNETLFQTIISLSRFQTNAIDER